MAIHDVDKSQGRLSPGPNRHDVAGSSRMAHGTNSVNYTTSASPSSQAGVLGGNARLVKADVVEVIIPAGLSSGTIHTVTTSVPHNLGYAPLALAYLNNSQLNGSGAYNLALPIPLSLADDTGGTIEHLDITLWMQYATDGTNFYVITYVAGSAGAPVGATYFVTYYLYQQQAAQ